MKNRIIPFLLMAIGSLCFGMLYIVIFMNGTALKCSPERDLSYNCNIKTLFFGKVQIYEKDVEGITNIVVAEDSCTDGCGYRPEFVLRDGSQTPLSSVWTDRGPVNQRVSQIRSQMDQGAEFTYTQDPPWWVLYLVVGLTIMSLFLSTLMLRKSNMVVT